MVERDREVLARTLDGVSTEAFLFIAEDKSGVSLGFIHLTTAADYYTGRETAHIADIVVAPDAGGCGVGSFLIAHAEDWTRARGFEMLTLNVFIANRRARHLYRRVGFNEEWIRCVKRL